MKKLLIIFCLLVFACNLEEVKREDKIKNVVVIPNKMDNNAFIIKRFLEDKFETSSNPNYKLLIEKKETIGGSGLGSDAITANFVLTINVSFKLMEFETGKVIFTGSASSYTNYLSARENVIADFFTQKSASENASQDVADKIYIEIQNRFGF
jgi:hypothetical protein